MHANFCKIAQDLHTLATSNQQPQVQPLSLGADQHELLSLRLNIVERHTPLHNNTALVPDIAHSLDLCLIWICNASDWSSCDPNICASSTCGNIATLSRLSPAAALTPRWWLRVAALDKPMSRDKQVAQAHFSCGCLSLCCFLLPNRHPSDCGGSAKQQQLQERQQLYV